MFILKFVSLAIFFLTISNAYAKGLKCWLPSSKDGSEMERLVVQIDGPQISVLEGKNERPGQSESNGLRTVLFHQFTDPKVTESLNPYNAEPPHSVILTKSNYNGRLEFAADIIIIDWGRGKLKTASSYHESFNTNWRCTRLD